jgi:hypothetical protein
LEKEKAPEGPERGLALFEFEVVEERRFPISE